MRHSAKSCYEKSPVKCISFLC